MPADALPLRPVVAADRDLIEQRLAATGETICDLTYANLRIWRDCEPASLTRVADCLCIRLDPIHEPPYFLEPLGCGPGDPTRALDACLADAGRVSRVREPLASSLPRDRYDVTPLRDHFDYLYDARSFAEMRGPRHLARRNRTRKFAREHPAHEFRALAAQDAPAALALFDRWRAERAPGEAPAGPTPSPDCQRRALQRAFEDFRTLELAGGAIVERGELLGFLVSSRAGATAVVHFLYAVPGLPGVSQTLLAACVETVFADAEVVNLEDDLGLPGLRRSKLAWHPTRLVAKYDVTRAGG